MIKVVKRGRRKETAIKECIFCRSTLQFSMEDIKTAYQYNEGYNYIICPVCNNTIDIDIDKAFPWED